MRSVKTYNLDLLKGDLIGGISVAALSLPVGVAYADIAGLPPESGIYTAIFSLLCYFILGSSKQLIIGPDSATMILFATTIFSIGSVNGAQIFQLAILITVVTGILMFIAGIFKLGIISNFLSKPILSGYLNGVSAILIISQIGKFTGLKMDHANTIAGIWELIIKAGSIHLPTLIIGIISLIVLKILSKISIRIPSPLILLVLSIIFVQIFDLQRFGIAFTPEIKEILPVFTIPDLRILSEHFPHILISAAALVFVSYTGEIPVARSFTKDKTDLKPNQEFFALGLADVVAGLFKGFPVSGADSRTAVNVTVGGKTKMVNIFASVIMLFVIIFFSQEFSLIPTVIFSAIIINAALGMFKLKELLGIRKFSKKEFRVTVLCILGVLLMGVYQGILLALVLTLIQLIGRASKPQECELVYEKDKEIISEIHKDNKGLINNDILIYRFNSSLVFFNSDYFKERIFQRADSKQDLKTVIIDATVIDYIDLTAMYVLVDVVKEFNEKKIGFVFAGADDNLQRKVSEELQNKNIDYEIFYPDVRTYFNSKQT